MDKIELAISIGGATHYFDPQDYDAIYDFLTEKLGWNHEDAEEAACWAENAFYEDEYETEDPDVEIYFVRH